MCFSIHRKYGRKQIATADITVYKVLSIRYDGTLRSLYFGTRYVKKRLYDLGISLKRSRYDKNDIHAGFHSYSTINMTTNNSPLLNNNYKHNSNYDSNVPVICRIPKGSEYYYNPSDEEYVSNKIIIDRYLFKKDVIIENGIQVLKKRELPKSK